MVNSFTKKSGSQGDNLASILGCPHLFFGCEDSRTLEFCYPVICPDPMRTFFFITWGGGGVSNSTVKLKKSSVGGVILLL